MKLLVAIAIQLLRHINRQSTLINIEHKALASRFKFNFNLWPAFSAPERLHFFLLQGTFPFKFGTLTWGLAALNKVIYLDQSLQFSSR